MKVMVVVVALVAVTGCRSLERQALNSINASITASESFITWADLNRNNLDPKTLGVAEQVRTKAPTYWATAYSALNTYRVDKSEEAESDLAGKVARVQALEEVAKEAKP